MVRLREVGIPLRPPGSLGVQPWWDEGRVGYGSDRTSRERRVRVPTDPRLPEVRHDPPRARADEGRIPGDVDPRVRTPVFVSGQARGQAEGEETVRGRGRRVDPEPGETARLVALSLPSRRNLATMRAFTGPAMNPEYEKALAAIRAALDDAPPGGVGGGEEDEPRRRHVCHESSVIPRPLSARFGSLLVSVDPIGIIARTTDGSAAGTSLNSSIPIQGGQNGNLRRRPQPIRSGRRPRLLDLSNPSRIVDACLGKPKSPRPRRRRRRRLSSESQPTARRISKRCSRPRSSRSGTTSRAEVGSTRPASSAQPAGVSSEATSRITSFTSSPRTTRPTRSTTATLGSGRSSRRRRCSSRTRRWSGSATRSLNVDVESDDALGGSMIAPRPTLYRDAALADPTEPSLRKGVSLLADAGRVVWIRPSTDEGDLPPNVRIIDAGGATIVPGMVDAHSHVTLPGGSHWIERGADPPEELLEVAEHNGALLGRAGVRWARDVGSPLAMDPRDGRRRALALRVRERWRSDLARPRVRVAGTWISHSGVLTGGLLIEADDGPSLLKAASA